MQVIKVVRKLYQDKYFSNVFLLALAFFFVRFAVDSIYYIEPLVIQHFGWKYNNTMNQLAFKSFSIISGGYSLFCSVAPILVLIGPKFGMCLATSFHIFFIVSLLRPYPWMVYIMSMIQGFTSAMLWQCMAVYLLFLSSSASLNGYVGLFWTIFQINFFLRNLLQYFTFKTTNGIDRQTIDTFFAVMFGIILIGLMFMLMLKNLTKKYQCHDKIDYDLSVDAFHDEEREDLVKDKTMNELFSRSIKLLYTNEVLLLIPAFIFLGIQQIFFGILSASVSHTAALMVGNSTMKYYNLIGASIGAGEILGGLFATLMAVYLGKVCAIGTATLLQVVANIFIILMLPKNSLAQMSFESPSMIPDIYTLLFCGLVNGFTNACFNTQLLVSIGISYSEVDAACVFGLWNLIYSFAYFLLFEFSTNLTLSSHIFLLTTGVIVAAITFIFFERKMKQSEEYTPINQH